eukprot:TRINITY_DN8013_c0_g1_i7.p1 TRINITY_DN8013_c0_g1~~TRINITY_DN8013_c0_g1_i7.p1  ORF type:complete len:1990 (-),score=647.36 TRINITY_DN8013_c0_g1_i7:109-6078(-)
MAESAKKQPGPSMALRVVLPPDIATRLQTTRAKYDTAADTWSPSINILSLGEEAPQEWAQRITQIIEKEAIVPFQVELSPPEPIEHGGRVLVVMRVVDRSGQLQVMHEALLQAFPASKGATSSPSLPIHVLLGDVPPAQAHDVMLVWGGDKHQPTPLTITELHIVDPTHNAEKENLKATIPLVQGKAAVSKLGAARFPLLRQFLGMLYACVREGVISRAIWTDMWKTALADAHYRYSQEQAKMIREVIARLEEGDSTEAEGKTQEQNNTDPNNNNHTPVASSSSPSPGHVRAVLEEGRRMGLLNTTQVSFMQDLASPKTASTSTNTNSNNNNNNLEAEKEAAITGELRNMDILFPLFSKVMPPSFEDKAAEVTHTLLITCRADTSSLIDKGKYWIDVLFRFVSGYPNVAPLISFADCNGCSAADLMVLLTMVKKRAVQLAVPFQNGIGRPAAFQCVQIIQQYLRELSSLGSSKEQRAQAGVRQGLTLPNMPKHGDFTLMEPVTNSTEFSDMSMSEVFAHACVGINRKVKQCTRFKYKLTSIENIMSRRLVARFARKIASLPQDHQGMYMPTLAFHGAPYTTTPEAIQESGLLSRGELDKDGRIITAHCTPWWGNGMYLSPDLEVVEPWHADSLGFQQVFVSLVFMGRPRYLSTYEMSWRITKGGELPPVFYQFEPPPDYQYDSHIAEKEFVVFDSERVLPIALLTYEKPGAKIERPPVDMTLPEYMDPEKMLEKRRRMRKGMTKEQRLVDKITPKHKSLTARNFISIHSYTPKTKLEELEEEKKRTYGRGILMYKLPGQTQDQAQQHWMVSWSPAERLEKIQYSSYGYGAPTASSVRLVLMLDKSASMGSMFERLVLPACSQLYSTLNPDMCSVVLFGKDVEVHTGISSQKWFDWFSPPALDDATNILAAYEKAIDIALDDNEKWTRERSKEILHETVRPYLSAPLDTQQVSLAEPAPVPAPVPVSERASSSSKPAPTEAEPGRYMYTAAYFDSLKEKIEKQQRNENRRAVYVFVLMSDGEDTINTDEQFQSAMERRQKMVQGAGLSTIFKVVGIGKESDTRLGMQMKLSVQTQHVWESAPCHYVRHRNMLPVAVRDMADDLRKVLADSDEITIPEDEQVHHEGLVSKITHRPTTSLSLSFHPTKPTTFLFKGRPPRHMCVGGSSFPVFPRTDVVYSRMEAQESLLLTLTSMVTDIKAAAVAGQNVFPSMAVLRAVVDGFKKEGFNMDSLHEYPAHERVQMVKTRKRLVAELTELLNGLEDEINLAKSKMNSDQAAMWLCQVSAMKFGAQSLRRALRKTGDRETVMEGIVAHMESIAQDYQDGKYSALPTDLISSASKLTAVGHLAEISQIMPSLRDLVLTDMLYSCGMLGVPIKVTRSEASNADPWRITVGYVSSERLDTASAMCALDAMVDWADKSGTVTQDVVIVADPLNPAPYLAFASSPLYDAYLGVVFTRSPDIVLPAQRTALLMITLVRAITQLLQPDTRTLALMRTIFHLIYTIRLRLKDREGGYWGDLVHKLTQGRPGRYMTQAEEDDIGSVAKILGAMCVLRENVVKERLLENKEHLAELALALMAETTCRSARVVLKRAVREAELSAPDIRNSGSGLKRSRDMSGAGSRTSNLPTTTLMAHQVIMTTLGITVETCIHPTPVGEPDEPIVRHSGAWNKQTAKVKSGNFFLKVSKSEFDNCPPQSVLACLTFACALAGSDFDDMTSALTNEEASMEMYSRMLERFSSVSMSTFLQTFVVPGLPGAASPNGAEVPPLDPLALQIALYVQGVRHHKSQERKLGLPSLMDPERVIVALATEARTVQYTKEFDEKLKELRLQQSWERSVARREVQKQQQAAFMAAHSLVPKAFSYEETERLNKDRPAADQLERLENGLLKHHCCFPQCPDFLRNMSTYSDRALGTRHGIYKHLKHAFYPEVYYIPCLHAHGFIMARRGTRSRDEYVASMLESKIKRPRSMGLAHYEAVMAALYDSFEAILNKQH